MQDSYGYHVSIFGVLMFGIIQGVSVVSADTNTEIVYKATGSSLDLSLNDSYESVLFAEWKFNNKKFAEYNPQHNYTLQDSQFSKRLKVNNRHIGVTIQDLQLQDSGTLSVTAFSTNPQHPGQTVKVYIQYPIKSVKIEKTLTWRVTTNSCDVDVKCVAVRDESVSYLWSGYKNGSGALLQFSLSPADGVVTLNCTAANNISSFSVLETLSCVIPEYVWFAVAGGAILLLVILIAALSCWWRSQKNANAADSANTFYADVKGPTAQKDKRSDSVAGMTVYETVDDLRVTPEMTIYAKVTLPQHTKTSATSSSPYQQVL